jgi:DNA-binding CsgD family transcriptional regulator
MAMNADRIERLTDKQRECLRMVYRHMETKEIARVLGLSPDGVTQRIKTAMKTLGVDRRRDAARILAEAEGLAPYPSHVHPSRDIASAPEPAMIVASTEGERQSGSSGEAMREEQAVYWAGSSTRRPVLPLPLPIGGASPDDLGWLKRLAWIAGIAIGIALAFGGLVGGVDALTRLLRG